MTVIFDTADSLLNEKKGMYEVPVHWRIGFLVEQSLRRLTDLDARTQVVVDAVEQTTGLSMAMLVIEMLIAKCDGEADQPLLPSASAEDLREAGRQKIQAAATAGTLACSPELRTILHLWLNWEGSEAPARFVLTLVAETEGTLQLLKSFEVRAIGHQLGDYAETERFYIRRDDVEPLISMDVLAEKVEALPAGTLDERGRRAVECFRKAMIRRIAGTPDEGPFIRD